MVSARAIAITGIGATLAAVSLIAPALGAPDMPRPDRARRLSMPSVIGGFTPSSADPKLAAVLARSGLDAGSFRFTPSESRRTGQRAVTVAVRARAQRAASAVAPGMTEPNSVGTGTTPLAPIAYNLGTSVGWKRFANAGDLTKLDLGSQAANRDRLPVGGRPISRGLSGAARVDAPHALVDVPKAAVADAPVQSLGVGGSYSLTRNLDVTAGVRYKSEKERLLRLEDNRRDSQAVYVGTAFRF